MIRQAFALLFFMALSVIVMRDARAQDYSQCGTAGGTNAACPSVDAAIAGMNNALALQCANAGQPGNDQVCPLNILVAANCSPVYNDPVASHSCFLRYNARTVTGTVSGNRTISRHVPKVTCPSGLQYNPATNRCDQPCSAKPPMQNVRFQVMGGSAGSSCSGGCEYAVDLQGGSGFSGLTTVGGVSFYRAASMSPTGATCTVGNQPIANDGEACATQGNLTQCVKEDGRHCATASTGKQFCWQPGENGIKASGNDAATKSPDGTTPKPPPLPPNNGGEWTQTGQSTVVTNVNGQTQSSNVTGWQSNYGGQGQGASGGGANGEGNSGSGSGSGLGGGSGNGEGEGEDDDGPGGPGAGVGDLYTPTDKTIGSVFNAFKARVSDSPIVDSIDAFFTVNATGGCPVFNVPGSEYWEAMSFDAHCSGDILQILERIGWVLMAVAAFLAAIWALS